LSASAAGPVTRAPGRFQVGNGLDMVDMVMGDENLVQRPAARVERIADGGGFGRVDRGGTAAGLVMDQIAVIVAAGGEDVHDQGHGANSLCCRAAG
jgi:hypothetical protein